MGPHPADVRARGSIPARRTPSCVRWCTGGRAASTSSRCSGSCGRCSRRGAASRRSSPRATRRTTRDIGPALDSFSTRALALDMRRAYGRVPARAGVCYFFPRPSAGSACKRLNLFLRWMIRHDEIDLGVWTRIPPSKLVVPLDTHIIRLGRCLRLTRYQTAGWKMAADITASLRALDPDDPVRFDFSLCHVGHDERLRLRPAAGGCAMSASRSVPTARTLIGVAIASAALAALGRRAPAATPSGSRSADPAREVMSAEPPAGGADRLRARSGRAAKDAVRHCGWGRRATRRRRSRRCGGRERVEGIAWSHDGYRMGFLVNGYELRVFDAEPRAPRDPGQPRRPRRHPLVADRARDHVLVDRRRGDLRRLPPLDVRMPVGAGGGQALKAEGRLPRCRSAECRRLERPSCRTADCRTTDQRPFVDRDRLGHHPLGAEGRVHAGAAGRRPCAGAASSSFSSRHDRLGHRVVVARRHEDARPAVLHDFRDPAGGGRDDRLAARHRVEQRGAEPLGDRAHHEDVERLVHRQHVRPEAGEEDVLLEVR